MSVRTCVYDFGTLSKCQSGMRLTLPASQVFGAAVKREPARVRASHLV